MQPYFLLFGMVLTMVTTGFIALFRVLLPLTRGVPFYVGLLSLGVVCSALVAGCTWTLALQRKRILALNANPGGARAASLDLGQTLERIVSFTFLAGSLNLAFFVAVPVMLDRSVSTWLLSRLPEPDAPQGVTRGELDALFQSEYIVKFDALGRRLDEQMRSGSVVVDEGGMYRATDRAEAFLTFSRVVARLYGIQTRFVERGDGAGGAEAGDGTEGPDEN